MSVDKCDCKCGAIPDEPGDSEDRSSSAVPESDVENLSPVLPIAAVTGLDYVQMYKSKLQLQGGLLGASPVTHPRDGTRETPSEQVLSSSADVTELQESVSPATLEIGLAERASLIESCIGGDQLGCEKVPCALDVPALVAVMRQSDISVGLSSANSRTENAMTHPQLQYSTSTTTTATNSSSSSSSQVAPSAIQPTSPCTQQDMLASEAARTMSTRQAYAYAYANANTNYPPL